MVKGIGKWLIYRDAPGSGGVSEWRTVLIGGNGEHPLDGAGFGTHQEAVAALLDARPPGLGDFDENARLSLSARLRLLLRGRGR